MDRYFYIVGEYNGQKEIHFCGNVYFNDSDETNKCYRHAEWCGLYLTVDEIQKLLAELNFYDYINEKVAYLGDLTQEEMIEVCRTYFNGNPGKMLRIAEVDEDTPCGDYWFE